MPELDALRRFQDDVPAPSDAVMAAARARLEAELERAMAMASPPPGRRRRRRRWAALALVPVALAAAGAGYALHHPARVASGIACGNEPRIWPGDMAILDPADGDAVGACAALWRAGVMTGGRPQASVPPLTPCVAATGAVVVLPSAEPGLCAKLGAEDLPPGDRAARARFVALRRALDARLGECVAGDAGTRALIRAELDRRGYSGWRVASRPGPPGGCGALAFAEDQRTVYAGP